jgi:rubrerythrin
LFSKHPLEGVQVKLGRDGAAEALRLAIIAELDAINLYHQLANSIEDPRLRKLFENIAREEKRHLGELLEALKRLDLEQAKGLEEGAKEAKEILEEKEGR